MTENCSNCLSITACTTHTPRDLHLSGSFLFNEELLEGTPCIAYNDNGYLQSVPQLPYNISINDGVDLYSIYIQCQLCRSMYMFNYYLTSK